jgi:GNAT superfamily N-acetyltransferase
VSEKPSRREHKGPDHLPYQPQDFAPINDLWRRARVSAFPDFQARKGHTAEEDRAYFRTVILIKNTVFVAEADGRAVGFMAIAGDFIDQLYVDPDSQRQGVGAALIFLRAGAVPVRSTSLHVRDQRERARLLRKAWVQGDGTRDESTAGVRTSRGVSLESVSGV